MGNVISVSNQKGGVGKTTSSVNIATELALGGKKVLLIDFDPQANATSGLGVSPLEEGQDLYDMFFGRVPIEKIAVQSQIPGLWVAPSSKDLISVEIELGKTPGRELILNSELKMQRMGFDYIIIDCPPSSGLLTLNALGASDWLLIPLQAEYYALEGVSALIKTFDFVCQTFNPDIKILGVFMTMFDTRTRLSSQVYQEAKNFFGEQMLNTVIPRNIKLSEAPSHGLPIQLYDKTSPGAVAYSALAREVHIRCSGYANQEGKNLVVNS